MIDVASETFQAMFPNTLSSEAVRAVAACAAGGAPVRVALPLFSVEPAELVMACSPGLGLHAAAVAYGCDVGAVTQDDIHDCLREFANVVGGCIVSDRLGGGDLGLPRMVSAEEFERACAIATEAADGAVLGMTLSLRLVPAASPDAGVN